MDRRLALCGYSSYLRSQSFEFIMRGIQKYLFFPVVGALLLVPACDKKAVQPALTDAGYAPGGLTNEQASLVLAKVGPRTITLGDFAAAIDNMNEFDRLRYQSPKRRRELLQELINLELLAIEAQRLGLDKDPKTQQAVRGVLRNELLRDTRKGLPAPAEIPLKEVRAYFEKHRDDYREPERRRVAVVIVKDKKEAEKVLELAKKASAMEWGKLVEKYSLSKEKHAPGHPLESLGELGIVGPMSDAKGANPRVPPDVRNGLFEITGGVGSVLDRVVPVGESYFIVRLLGKTPAHERSFAEAERSIRAIILQTMFENKEKELHDRLQKKYTVNIDQQVLATVHVPGEPSGTTPQPSPSSSQPVAPKH
jgi:peptidyl-prolyl cis-trans isomerase C